VEARKLIDISMNFFRLQFEEIKADWPAEWRSPEAAGAYVFFEGTVRGKSDKGDVIRLEFEAYETMVYKELERIAQRIRDKYEIMSIGLIHRLGIVLPGEAAVLAAVTAAHRGPAFEACAMLMDELKNSVPIWKKEVFADGEIWVSAHP
jgi:molybdopterin synthase catalytic subunit